MKKVNVNRGRLQLARQKIANLTQLSGGNDTVGHGFTITRECELQSGHPCVVVTSTCAQSIGACTLNPAYSGC